MLLGRSSHACCTAVDSSQQLVFLLRQLKYLQATSAKGTYTPKAADRRRLADHLMSFPEDFFDMRQIKLGQTHPDFKHKMSGQALWLNSAPADLLQLVSRWDANDTAVLKKVHPAHPHHIVDMKPALCVQKMMALCAYSRNTASCLQCTVCRATPERVWFLRAGEIW